MLSAAAGGALRLPRRAQTTKSQKELFQQSPPGLVSVEGRLVIAAEAQQLHGPTKQL